MIKRTRLLSLVGACGCIAFVTTIVVLRHYGYPSASSDAQGRTEEPSRTGYRRAGKVRDQVGAGEAESGEEDASKVGNVSRINVAGFAYSEGTSSDMTLVTGDLPVPLDLVPREHLMSLALWHYRQFLLASQYLENPDILDAYIDTIPVEDHTSGVNADDILDARRKIKEVILTYSSGCFDRFLELRGGEEALATIDESSYARQMYDAMLRMDDLRERLPVPPPESLLDAYRLLWDAVYENGPEIDKVSFDLSFIAFHEENQESFDANAWHPRPTGLCGQRETHPRPRRFLEKKVHNEPAAQCRLLLDRRQPAFMEEAGRHGSLSEVYAHRALENKTTPEDVMARNGRIRYFDFLVNTGQEGKLSFPIMFRYYHDPESQKWLSAFYAPFYNLGFEGTDAGVRNILH